MNKGTLLLSSLALYFTGSLDPIHKVLATPSYFRSLKSGGTEHAQSIAYEELCNY